MHAKVFQRLINFWPPFLAAGVRAEHVAPDYREVRVALDLHWYNRNYVGTHFGGSLFAMTDPWHMLMLIQRLGPGYVVWDKRSSIDFVAPGKGKVTARFEVTDAQLEAIRSATADGSKHLPEFHVEVLDAAGKVVARVHKVLHVRRRDARRPA